MEKTVYCGTRTLAREAAKELNGKFKDMGKDAPTGERWVVLIEVPDQAVIDSPAYQEAQILRDNWNLINDAGTIANQRPGIIGEQVLKTPNNKPVRVSWRRSMLAVRLAEHIAKVS